MIDVLYVGWNRLEMTKPSFESVAENTNWDLVGKLVIHDDGSTDGTAKYLSRQAVKLKKDGVEVRYHSKRLGGPVAAMNAYLARKDREPLFAKVDNDFVMPPGWLDDLCSVMTIHPDIDILGTEPFVGLDGIDEIECGEWPQRTHEITEARHIGGKGLIRTACFADRPMYADGRQGFTQWQHRHEEVRKAWITPDLRAFGLDQLPFEPWVSLTERYVAEGWQRAWPKYQEATHAYWDWFFA